MDPDKLMTPQAALFQEALYCHMICRAASTGKSASTWVKFVEMQILLNNPFRILLCLCSGLENMAYEGDESCANHVCIPDDSLDTPYKPACTRLIEEYMQHRFKLN